MLEWPAGSAWASSMNIAECMRHALRGRTVDSEIVEQIRDRSIISGFPLERIRAAVPRDKFAGRGVRTGRVGYAHTRGTVMVFATSQIMPGRGGGGSVSGDAYALAVQGAAPIDLQETSR
jgi:hypothetical protein